jgi:hypothetical protein
MKQMKVGTRVAITDVRIQQLDSTSANRYRERVGAVIGYRPGAEGPLIELDADEFRRSEILQDVAPAYLNIIPD